MSVSDIREIQKILHNVVADQNYNRIASKSFLATKLYAEGGFSFSKWTVDKAWNKAPKVNGGDCVDVNEVLLQMLPKSMNAQVIPAILPSRYQQKNAPKYMHAAVIIKYRDINFDGYTYILLDPSFDVADPVILNNLKDSVTIKTGKGDWNFVLREDKIFCYAEHFGLNLATNEPDKITYILNKFDNYNDHIKQTLVLADLAPSIVVTNELGHKLAHVKVDLKKSKLVWAVDSDTFEESFDAVLKTGFPNTFERLSSYLGNEFIITKDQILTIINNREKMISVSENVN